MKLEEEEFLCISNDSLNFHRDKSEVTRIIKICDNSNINNSI